MTAQGYEQRASFPGNNFSSSARFFLDNYRCRTYEILLARFSKKGFFISYDNNKCIAIRTAPMNGHEFTGAYGQAS
jgi:hypothetical protein